MIPATTIIKSLRKGAADEDIAKEIDAAVERVKATGKKAKVSIILTIEPAGMEKDAKDLVVDKVWISDEVKLALPKLPTKKSLMFIKEDSNDLTKDAPQTSIHGIREDVKSA